MRLLQSILLVVAVAAAACAPRAGTYHPLPTPNLAPSGAPSAEPAPLPTYPYEPGFWV